MFQKHVSSVSSAFRHMLQVLHFDVSKVNRVLHLPCHFSAISSRCLLLLRASARHPPPPTPLPDAGDIWGGEGNLRRKWMGGRRRSCHSMSVLKAGGGANVKRDRLGCPDGEARKGAWDPTCARMRVNGAAGTGVRAPVRPIFYGTS
jgi:hypothetical protein